MTPDWKKIRRDYSRGATQAALQKRYGVASSTLRGRIRREGWTRSADAEVSKVEQLRDPTPQNAASDPRMERVDALADAMLGCLERAVKELDTVTQSVREKAKLEDGAEVVTDFERLLPTEKGIIDRGGLKQLTGVLKDIKDVLTLRPEADVREQEARIAKLRRELDREQDQQSIRVTLEGESLEYAE